MLRLVTASPYSGQVSLPNGSVGISTDPQDTTKIIGSISDNANVRQKSFLDSLLGIASQVIGNISINKSGGNVSVMRTTDSTAQAGHIRIPGTFDPTEPQGITAVLSSPLILLAGAALIFVLLKD